MMPRGKREPALKMIRNRTLIARTAALAAALLFTAISGCRPEGGDHRSAISAQPGSPPPGKTITIGMIPKLTGIAYFNACRRGAEEAARELGVKLVYDGPLTADSVRQSEIVNSWILRGFDVLAVAPNNPEAIVPVLRKARERGIHVITWDTDAVPEARECFCNQVGAETMASALVDIMAEEIGGKGKVALVSGTETAANQNTWMRFMREYAARSRPGITFIDPVEYPGEDDARSYQSAQGLLRRPERPDGIVGMTSVSAPAVAKAVFDARLAGKVAVTGITLPSALKPYLKNGTVKRFVLWNPVDLGYLAVHAARRLAEKGRLGEELEAGRLGKLKVKDGEIILGPPVVFDASNVDRYDF
jgi:rhamnose transport system substrate-binding protein